MQESKINTMHPNERGIDLLRLIRVLWKWKFVIVAVALIAGIVSFVYSQMFIAPSYRSSFTAYVNNRLNTTENQNITSSSDLSASRSLAYLYQDIITSRSVLTEAAESCGLDYTYQELWEMVSTSVADSTALISVYVEMEDPQAATELATAIAEVAPEHVARVVDGSSMRIVDSPVKPQGAYAPNSWNNALNCALIALCVSAILAIVLDLVFDKVQSGREMEERYGIVVVGYIPDLAQADRQRKAYNTDGAGRYRK